MRFAPRTGAGACLHPFRRTIPHPSGMRLLLCLRSGGVRAASLFVMTPACPEALDHRLMASTPPAKGGVTRFRSQRSSAHGDIFTLGKRALRCFLGDVCALLTSGSSLTTLRSGLLCRPLKRALD